MLPRIQRMRTSVVDLVLKEGKTLHSPHFSFKYTSSKEAFPRFAVVVSKKVSKKAVVRNRNKRRIYASIRLFLKNSPSSKAISGIVFVKTDISALTQIHISNEIGELLKKVL